MAEIADHVASCTECGGTVFRFRTIKSLLGGDYSQDPPLTSILLAQTIFAANRKAAEPAAQPFWSRLPRPHLLPLTKRFSTVAAWGAMILLPFLLFFGGVLAVNAATQPALAGDLFYPVKIQVEALQLALTPDDSARVQLHLGFAQTRTQEIKSLSLQRRFQDIARTSKALENEWDQTLLTLDILESREPDRAITLSQNVTASLSDNQQVLAEVLGKVPDQASQAIEHAIQASDHAKSTLKDKGIGKPATTPSKAATSIPTRTATPSSARTLTPTRIPPGQIRTPGEGSQAPAQTKTPGPLATPPGQSKTPNQP